MRNSERRNPGAGNAGASEVVKLWGNDASEIIPAPPFMQAVRIIARRHRVSLPHAAVIAEMMRRRA